MLLNNKNLKTIGACIFVLLFLLPVYGFAETTGVDELKKQFNKTAEKAGFEPTTIVEKTVPEKIGYFIQVILGFIGGLATLFIIYGGFLWITAGGNEEQLKNAKKIITNSALGISVVVIAYLLVGFLSYLASTYFFIE
jgi:hypothetical protein